MKHLSIIMLIPTILLSACVQENKTLSDTNNSQSVTTAENKSVSNTIVVQESIATGKNSTAINSLNNQEISKKKIVQHAIATGENSQALNAGGDINLK